MPRKDEVVVLTPGSTYRIRSLESRDKPMETVGTFRGYAAVAHDTAIVMELEKKLGEERGMTRLIPSHMILSIDVLNEAKPEEEKKDKDSNAVYFG